MLDPHAHPQEQELNHNVNIVLSPALYWVKKVDLPIKTLRALKKILPSLFEDTLPEGNYNYTAMKDGEHFIAFAYEDAKIIALLQRYGIALSQIKGVYFAQNEFRGLTPMQLNDKEVLVEQDGVVVIAPKTFVADEAQPLELQNLKLSSFSITLQNYSHIVDKTTLYKIAFVLGMFIAVVYGEYFITHYKVTQLQEAKQKLFSEYKLLPTMMQNKAVLQKYKKRFERQSKLRELLATLLKLKLQNGERYTLVEYKENLLHFVVEGVKNKEQFLKQLSTLKTEFTTEYKNNKLNIRIKL